MRVLITGGAGFIGQHLAGHMAPLHDLVALDLLSTQVHIDPAASRQAFPGTVEIGDVSKESAWASMDRPDVLIHLAAETGTGQSMYERDRYHRVNVHGTRLACKAAVRWGVPLIAMSSRAVYGEGRTDCDRHGTQFGVVCCDQATPAASAENDPHMPVSFYGETKSQGETVLTAIETRIPVSIVRPQNVVGPGQALHNPYTGVLAAFLARLREDLSLLVYGDGSDTRDFVHVEDVASLLTWCAAHPPTIGHARILNAGTGTRISLDDLAAAAAAGSPRRAVNIEHVPVHRAGDIKHACADLTLLAAIGAPRPRWSSRDAIIDFVQRSWDKPGASSRAWDQALSELDQHGLTA